MIKHRSLQFSFTSKPLLSFFKVDDIPDCLEIISLDVQVLKIKGVLPDVDADDRNMAQQRILISGRDDFELIVFRVKSKPTPTRTLNGRSGGVELLLQVVEASKGLVDRVFERTSFQNTTVAFVDGCRWCHVLPEQGVVDVTTTIELESCLKGDAFFRGTGSGVSRFCRIQSVDVGLMMLGVMKDHDLFGYVGFESIVAVWKVRKCVGH